jgi:hypothetical protein
VDGRQRTRHLRVNVAGARPMGPGAPSIRLAMLGEDRFVLARARLCVHTCTRPSVGARCRSLADVGWVYATVAPIPALAPLSVSSPRLPECLTLIEQPAVVSEGAHEGRRQGHPHLSDRVTRSDAASRSHRRPRVAVIEAAVAYHDAPPPPTRSWPPLPVAARARLASPARWHARQTPL